MQYGREYYSEYLLGRDYNLLAKLRKINHIANKMQVFSIKTCILFAIRNFIV